MEKKVSYCGLFCPSCYKNVVSRAAYELRNTLSSTHICSSPSEPSSSFKQELDRLVELKCPSTCKEGAGNPDCKIRLCCIENKKEGCWECNSFESCENLKEQFVSNIKRIKQVGLAGFAKEQTKV